MDTADLVHITLRHLTPGATAAQRDEFVDQVDRDAEQHDKLAKARTRRRFQLRPDPNAD